MTYHQSFRVNLDLRMVLGNLPSEYNKVWFFEKMMLTFSLSRLSMDLTIQQSSMARRICLCVR